MDSPQRRGRLLRLVVRFEKKIGTEAVSAQKCPQKRCLSTWIITTITSMIIIIITISIRLTLLSLVLDEQVWAVQLLALLRPASIARFRGSGPRPQSLPAKIKAALEGLRLGSSKSEISSWKLPGRSPTRISESRNLATEAGRAGFGPRHRRADPARGPQRSRDALAWDSI